MKVRDTYHYIIAGAGASGLSLAWHMVHSPLKQKRILVIDSDLSSRNDKTWSFWHKGDPPFENLIHKKWETAEISFNSETISNPLREYPYYCIKSSAYRSFILDELDKYPTVDLLEAPIEQISGSDKNSFLQTANKRYSAEFIFQSCFVPPQFRSSGIRYRLVQSFLGYDIETQQPLFDPDTFMLMDFDESYNNGLAFIYILPWSNSNGLLEYTIFDEQIKPEEFYRKKIELYLSNKYGLKRIDYQIRRTEYGEIPMQDLPYAPWYQPRVMNLGRSGGLTKPSTGYTFKRIQEHSKSIVASLLNGGMPALPYRSSFRYRAYDLWLLQIMHDHPNDALRVFKDLFSKNSIDSVFKFLDEQNSFTEDLKIMSNVPYLPFFRAIWKSRKRLWEI